MNLDWSTLITATIPSLIILGVGWLVARVVRANRADSDGAIRTAVVESEDRIKQHVDAQVDSLRRAVQRIDSAQQTASRDVAWLYGHLGQTPPTFPAMPAPEDGI